MRNPTWKHGFILLAILTALIALLIWDQTDRPVTNEIVVEPAVMVTPIETTTTTVDLSWINTTTTTKPKPAATHPPKSSRTTEAFFECIRWRESRGNYQAVNSTGTFMGAYQFYQGGWDTFAGRIGRHDLVGVKPNHASPADQDAVALGAYNELGAKPWNGACQ
jgi:hypothetical protein